MSGIFGLRTSKKDESFSDKLLMGIFSLQHTGEHYCGVVTATDRLHSYRHEGEVLDDEFVQGLNRLPGNYGIGNVSPLLKGPISFRSKLGKKELSITYSGKILNKRALTNQLFKRGQSLSLKHSDAEVIGKLITEDKEVTNVVEGIEKMASQVKGVYGLGVLTLEGMYVFRSPVGVEPLYVGENGSLKAFASESCAIKEALGLRSKNIRDVKPGEIIFIGDEIKTVKQLDGIDALCGFQPGYWARIDSFFGGVAVKSVRDKAGEILGGEDKIRGFKADIVIPVRDSGVGYAIGYQRGAGVYYDEGLFKVWYIGRTFLDPSKKERLKKVDKKQAVIEEAIDGKIVTVVDDSIREGKTIRDKLIPSLKWGGAKEVHVRIGTPENKYSCRYTVFSKKRGPLLAAVIADKEKQREYIGADSLEYISLKGYLEALQRPRERTCLGCWTNNFPI